MRKIYTILVILSLIALAGCSSGGGGGNSGGNTNPAIYSISGTVKAGGVALSGVQIALTGVSTGTATTDAEGKFTFSNRANGNYTAQPSLAGYTFSPLSKAVTIEDGNESGVDFTATTSSATAYTISGKVTGAVVSGVIIALSGTASGSTTTDSGGNYSFSVTKDGGYTLTAALTGYTFSPPSISVTMESADVADQNFTAAAVVPTYSISGTVSGSVKYDVTIESSGGASKSTKTATTGKYTLTGLASGIYYITPSKTGYTFYPTLKQATIESAGVTGVDFTSYAGDWSKKAVFGGEGRYGAVGFSIGSKGYIGTGYDGTSLKNDFWEYDPSANAWTQKADFGGTERESATGFSIGTKGYIGTGFDGGSRKKDFWEYDPSVNTWAQKANFGGTARKSAVGFSIGTKGYIGTGYDGTALKKDFWQYDPSTDTWSQVASFGGTARESAAGFSIGTKGYVGTGYDAFSHKNDFWEYNSATDRWKEKTAFGGTMRYRAVGFSIGTKGYIGTGLDENSRTKDVWEYDPSDNTWAQCANFGGTARDAAVGFSIDATGYIGTGRDDEESVYNDFWKLVMP